ncbi:MAG TPA: alpha/beta hydrolase-fold protein [Myxococcaceae bacterium]
MLATASFAACAVPRTATRPTPPKPTIPGRLALEVPKQVPAGLSPGVHSLSFESGSALLYVPKSPPGPRPLLVVFHGAGGQARHMINLLWAQAEEQGLLLLAPQSSGPTWDLVTGDYGPDVAVLQQLLTAVSSLEPVDPARMGLAGFSDGASYALALGLDNGDLFSSVLAFSPGFLSPEHRVGSPRVFVAHGTADPVLDIDKCGRAVVNQLRDLGYGVTYREFDGPHTVPKEIAGAATKWFSGGTSGS